MAGAVERAAVLVDETEGGFMPSQFDNQANPLSHEQETAQEILEQTDEQIDAFVAGVGTGGTLTGVGRTLRARLGDKVRLIAVEPASSAVLSGNSPAEHGIQGLGAGFVPTILDRDLIDDIVAVSEDEAVRMAAHLARRHGLLVGPSSGANAHVACTLASQMGRGNVVTILCDSGARYLL